MSTPLATGFLACTNPSLTLANKTGLDGSETSRGSAFTLTRGQF